MFKPSSDKFWRRWIEIYLNSTTISILGDGSHTNNTHTKEIIRYGAIGALLTSSQALSLYTLALMRQQPGLQVYNYGPGLVQTSLGRNMPFVMNLYVSTIGRLFSISGERVGSEIKELLSGKHPSGFYLRGVKANKPNGALPEVKIQERLVNTTEQLIQNVCNEQAA